MPQVTRSRATKKPNGKSTEPLAIALARRAGEAAMADAARTAKRPAKKAPAAKRAAPRVTKDEQELAALLEARLRQLGLEGARVTAAPGPSGAELRFEGIPASKVDVLRKAIGR
jgi:hypothetical protein